jgi:peptidoglycan/LPS O-acetylase OafA/YrhL
MAFAVALWRVADAHFDWVGRWNPDLRGQVGRTDYRLDILLFGCAVALIWDDPRVQALMRRIGGSLLAIGAAVAAICCQVWTPPGYLTLVAILMALLPAATVAKPESWLGRFLELPLLAWIGRMSYSLYVWQQLFLSPQPIGVWQQAPWNVAAAFACAVVSFYGIERPASRIGHRLL